MLLSIKSDAITDINRINRQMNETITELAWAQFRQQIEPEIAAKRVRFRNTVPESQSHCPKHLRDAGPNIVSIYEEDEP